MDFLELSRMRYSVLEYEHRPVEQEKINKIMEAGLSAPTACNYQPQRVLIIDDDESRQKLNHVVQNKCSAPVAFLICYNKHECWIRPADGKPSGDIDASIVATHMMMEATDLGLGSIWVMNWDPKRMKSEFALGDEIEPTALLIVGYKSEKAAPRQGHLVRKREEEILLSTNLTRWDDGLSKPKTDSPSGV